MYQDKDIVIYFGQSTDPVYVKPESLEYPGLEKLKDLIDFDKIFFLNKRTLTLVILFLQKILIITLEILSLTVIT